MTEPKLSLDEAKAVVATKTAPRVTEESIKAKIASVDYITSKNLMTICLITMKNGFIVNGVSAPASPTNYDAEVGKRYAYDNAFKQLWPLEGYLLREKLSQA
jgi:Phage protein (N4 Gp49/phage Sf6 gene 66) family